MDECPRCGWPESEVYDVLSRHLTSEGVVTYTRCACGEVQVRVQPFAPGAVVSPGPAGPSGPNGPDAS
ncbi:hypothetical protein [Actinomadura chibensis]|uniref:Uncharacterized protein n=1 Tax=Actinomadura chibensis TaxID=392828 RepID=A0A5D0N1C1_9ACTN|nr:hypothetical protein [Actinomadura chibensis]TYB37985.1 hypothetical protein FXF69_41655 [Actinomadura chibensis]